MVQRSKIQEDTGSLLRKNDSRKQRPVMHVDKKNI